jgi:hypothetical protein
MPQMVIWPFMARTMVEGRSFVKVRLKAPNSARPADNLPYELSPPRHDCRQKRAAACGNVAFSPDQVTKPHRLTRT